MEAFTCIKKFGKGRTEKYKHEVGLVSAYHEGMSLLSIYLNVAVHFWDVSSIVLLILVLDPGRRSAKYRNARLRKKIYCIV